MITSTQSTSTTVMSIGRRIARASVWVLLGFIMSMTATGWTILHMNSARRQVTVVDLVVVVAISSVMWVICLIPLAWLVHGRLGRNLRTELWYDVRRVWWQLRNRRSAYRVAPSVGISRSIRFGSAPARSVGPTPAPVVQEALPPTSGVEQVSIPAHTPVLVKIPDWLRARRPDSLLLNGAVSLLASDGDVLTAPWAIGAFFDVVQNGVTGVPLDTHAAITTARKDLLDIGIQIAAEVVGTKVPARLPERLEQRQFLVTACVLKHYDMAVADEVRAMLRQWGYDPRRMWGAVEAYLSGYYHCRSWETARGMSARHFCLPPPPYRMANHR